MTPASKLASSLALVFVLSSSALAAPPACPTTILGSCANQSQEGQQSCVDVISSEIPLAQFRTQCEAEGSVFSSGACSATSLVGSCVFASGTEPSLVLRMYAPMLPEYVPMVCTQAQAIVCQ